MIDELLDSIIAESLNESPEGAISDWAGENVYLSGKETPRPGFYDVSSTPWNRRVMELKKEVETREVIVMKSSRSGVTEACLNTFRWMPQHAPGPVLYAINSLPKAKEVMTRRLVDHFKRICPEKLTSDPDDLTSSLLKLTNMDIAVAGSGSAGPFMEGWFQSIILDEYEEHATEHEETTADRARGRQTTVDDPTLYIISKPILTNGPIHKEYLRGSQEKYHVPCPHCGKKQELIWEYMRFDHCKTDRGYDMEAVLESTYYQCKHCGEKIEESSKFEMVQAGEWVPEPDEKRGGVKHEAGVVSLHVSDLYSMHPQVSWGKLAAKFLAAYVINPDYSKKKFFFTNHLGLPWENRSASIGRGDLDKLRGGIIEEHKDGTRVQVGAEYRWCYLRGEYKADLPIVPSCITMTVDKQAECLKGVVFAWSASGEAYPIEFFTVLSEPDVLLILEGRVYKDAEGVDHKILGGLIDSGYKPKEVYRACIKSKEKLRPSKGMGMSEEFRGKSMKTRRDFIEGRSLLIYDYYNHGLESDFYLSKIKERSEPRLWLPIDFGDEFGRELCSSYQVVKNNRTKWERKKDVPNDFGDCCKMQYLIYEILMFDRPDLWTNNN